MEDTSWYARKINIYITMTKKGKMSKKRKLKAARRTGMEGKRVT